MILLIIFIAIFAGIIFITIKMQNVKERATQHILKGTGISNSDINAGISSEFEKKHLETFLRNNPGYTEESLKEILKKYADCIIAKDPISEFNSGVVEKMNSDSKLDKMQSMIFKRATVNGYINNNLIATVVYTDNKDEYEVYMTSSVTDGKIQLEKYSIRKGAVVGF